MAASKFQAAVPKTVVGKSKAVTPLAGGAVPREKIAARAYQIWQESGCPDGHDQDHWLQAERELRAARPASRAA
jgi:hypothetical protein